MQKDSSGKLASNGSSILNLENMDELSHIPCPSPIRRRLFLLVRYIRKSSQRFIMAAWLKYVHHHRWQRLFLYAWRKVTVDNYVLLQKRKQALDIVLQLHWHQFEHARSIDPTIQPPVPNTHMSKRQWEKALCDFRRTLNECIMEDRWTDRQATSSDGT